MLSQEMRRMVQKIHILLESGIADRSVTLHDHMPFAVSMRKAMSGERESLACIARVPPPDKLSLLRR